MPTSSPIAQAAVPGRPIKIKVARMRSTMPLASIQPQRPESWLRCSSANMIEAMPSNMKKTISTKVSENTPVSGQPKRITPTRIASTAEASDHQNPGACRIRKVVTNPTIPLIRISQPIRIATASDAIGGRAMATRPRTTRTKPSTRNKTQWARIDCTSAL